MFPISYFPISFFPTSYFPKSSVTSFVFLSARSGFKVTDQKITAEKQLPFGEWIQEKRVQDNLEVNQRWVYETSKFPPR